MSRGKWRQEYRGTLTIDVTPMQPDTWRRNLPHTKPHAKQTTRFKFRLILFCSATLTLSPAQVSSYMSISRTHAYCEPASVLACQSPRRQNPPWATTQQTPWPTWPWLALHVASPASPVAWPTMGLSATSLVLTTNFS